MLSIGRRYVADGGDKTPVLNDTDRTMLHGSTGRVLSKIVVILPIARRSNRPRSKSAAAIRTDIAQHSFNAVGAERTFVAADARLR